jgi:hypothetical protein
MQRVYLDQKDFSRIAKGRLALPDFAEDAGVFEFLVRLVEEGRVRIYSSWGHIVEAFRYRKDRLDLLEPYCEVADRLTQGHCIRFPLELERMELELALAKRFGFSTDLDEREYPYGRYAAAVGLHTLSDLDLKDQFLQDLLERLEGLPLRNKEKKRLRQKLSKEGNLRKLLKSLPEAEFLRLAEKLPSAPGFYSRQNIMDILLGTPATRQARISELLNGAFTFKNLITSHSQRFPELKKLGSLFDEDSRRLGELIRGLQLAQGIVGESFIRERETGANLTTRFVNYLEPRIFEYGEKHKFSVQEAKTFLLESRLRSIPCLGVAVALVQAYSARHKGVLGKGRKPLESDIMDLQHLRNLPYVDFHVTDRFAAEVAKDASTQFGTKVLRNLNELREALRQRISP